MDLLKDLTQIGFTEYEAKVYLTLLRDYPATGYQVSKDSGVPRSMVYETLSRLHGRGFVLETTEGRATLYRPLPPKTLLARRVSEHERLITDLRGGLVVPSLSFATTRALELVERIYLPLLRQRRCEVPQLLDHFIAVHGG